MSHDVELCDAYVAGKRDALVLVAEVESASHTMDLTATLQSRSDLRFRVSLAKEGWLRLP